MQETCVDIIQLEQAFQKNFQSRGELGASVSVWQHGEPLASLHAGWCEREQQRPWTQQTLVPFYSSTKGMASALVLLLMDEASLTPNTLVREVWPEFPFEGSLGEMLSHQLGLAALEQTCDTWDYSSVIDAIESQTTPNWQRGAGHGYHPRTFGFLLEKITKNLVGEPLGEVWRRRIAEPLGLELWIGLPEAEFHRVARLYPGKQDKSDLESGFYRELHTPDSLVKRAFTSPRGLHSVREMNEPRAWQAALPAMGGIGTADSLAKFYQAAIGEIPMFSPNVRHWMETPLVSGMDRILCANTALSCGFQLDPLDAMGRKMRYHYGQSRRAFGHPGAGGSHAFGDPENGLSFAYTMNQMELSPLPGEKSLNMIRALFR